MKKGIDFIGITICWFCHDGEGNFVMTKRGENCRDEQGCWDTGGGALEMGDQVENRLKIEIKEELGADILKKEFLGYRDVHRRIENKETHWVALDFKVLVNRNRVINGEPHKFDQLKWFNFNNLPQKIHSEQKFFFEKYKDKLNLKKHNLKKL